MALLDTFTPSRRAVLAGGAGLVVAAVLPMKGRASAMTDGATEANAFIKIAPDDTVTVLIKHIEFGQGPFTGLATIAAEELDADWAQVRAEHAPSNVRLYGNSVFGFQGTGGSTAIRSSYDVMRNAGAGARAMLVSAAAKKWGVPAEEITVSKGVIAHKASGKESGFGALADLAAQETAPEQPTLKDPKDFVLIGTIVPKIDTLGKTTGGAVFGLDIYEEGMATVIAKHPDVFGATVASFDATDAKKVNGVRDVKQIGDGVAIYADNTYAALKARKALKVEWDLSNAETRSSDEIIAERLDAVKSRGVVATDEGAVDDAFAKARTVHEATYSFPYLVHAPMEPLDGVMMAGEDGGVDAYFGSQIPTLDHGAIARTLGMPMNKVRIHTQLAGGSFGRRAQGTAHFATELAETFKAGDGSPVKLVWTREDDIQGGYYRPATAHKLRGGLDRKGNIVAWENVIAAQTFTQNDKTDKVDSSMVEGSKVIPYAIPNIHVSAHIINSPVTTLWWRSVGHTTTGYAVETFIDELLEKGKLDAVDGRLALMQEAEPRLAATLEKVAEMANWGSADLPDGHALGVASVKSFESYVSQIAQVSMEDGVPKVHKVWCAVDCGVAINPQIIKAQMEGGIGYGLGAVLFNELKIKPDGQVAQSNFHDYRSLRIGEMPRVEVEIIPSAEHPSGVGEPGTPPIGPAVANAVRKLTGAPVHSLPMVKASYA